MFHSGNPTLNDSTFDAPARWDDLAERERKATTMTVMGTVNATAILLGVCIGVAVLCWYLITNNPALVTPMWLGGMLGGLVLGLVITFKPRTAPFLSPIYAGLEGAFLAGFSYFIAVRWMPPLEDGSPDTGIVFQAVGITFAIFAGMLTGYWTGIIRVGPVVAKIMMTALIGLVLYVVALFLLNGVFGLGLPNLYTSASPMGIGFTAICLGLASLFLILDFQFIEEGAKAGAPKHMEWYGAFGLLVTLVWIYVEVLRLLAKLRSSD